MQSEFSAGNSFQFEHWLLATENSSPCMYHILRHPIDEANDADPSSDEENQPQLSRKAKPSPQQQAPLLLLPCQPQAAKGHVFRYARMQLHVASSKHQLAVFHSDERVFS